jgi:hypothetical protein
MDFEHSEKVKQMQSRLQDFMSRYVIPVERRFYDEEQAGNPYTSVRLSRSSKPRRKKPVYGTCSCPMTTVAPV